MPFVDLIILLQYVVESHVSLNKSGVDLASRVTILIQLCLFLMTRMMFQAAPGYTPAPIS